MATETVVITKTDFTQSSFYLPRHETSIYTDINAREYPDIFMIYGFIHKQMGIKLRKHIAKTYPDEHTHYKKYVKLYNHDDECIETKYSLSTHKWGRINADRSLSLSLFHRPSRHSFVANNYIDHDIQNAQLKILMSLAVNEGLELTGGLEEYCSNPKQNRYAIASHYKLEDIKDDDGFTLTAYEQSKKLPLRLAFGGELDEWKKAFVRVRIPDMKMVLNLQKDLVIIRNKIIQVNPHIRWDLEKDVIWASKTNAAKDRSIMGLYSQTWERIIQEHCIAHLVRLYGLQIGDIIPSQDGFMTLKKDFNEKQIDIKKLYDDFNLIVQKKFNIDVKWEQKNFDEAIFIPHSHIVPIDISFADLQKGETCIAKLVSIPLKKKLYYSSITKLWYYTNKTNIWMKTKETNEWLISNTIQYYIDLEIRRIQVLMRECKDDYAKLKPLTALDKGLNKCRKTIVSSSSLGLIIKYLRVLLLDNDFEKKLDMTAGSIVFSDGIFDLKKGQFRAGIRKDDYVSFTLSLPYRPSYNNDKMIELRNILKKILNWNDTHLEYYLSVLGHAFTGEAHLEKSIYYIVDGTLNGKGDNGKTFFFDILTHIFPEYVKTSTPTLLEDANTKSHKQLPMLDGARIVWLDEGTKKKVNAALLKKIGDGMKINTDVMYGNTVDLLISYKMFICSNHVPKIDKDEDAVYNRLKQIQFCSHFDRTGCLEEDNYETLDFIADKKLGDSLKSGFIDEIVGLVLDYAMKYYVDGLPPIPREFIEAVDKTKIGNNDFATWFYENYEPKTGHNISIDEIEGISTYKRKDIIKELSSIGIKWNKNLKDFDVKIKNVGGKETNIIGGVPGFSRICEVVEEE